MSVKKLSRRLSLEESSCRGVGEQIVAQYERQVLPSSLALRKRLVGGGQDGGEDWKLENTKKTVDSHFFLGTST
jgi:hypothetical protein